ncbi:Uncharacterised protein [Candidatus Ornithobacterium hominis]|uniref:Uncharacterized protein n=2 Tax=Candidatus Ornithobacterium hominis TaxID=2497989 RepID=A0A383U2X7_9FLAO|nr:Uncharacterised protein [Candidatus Ornithobacterium hominis]
MNSKELSKVIFALQQVFEWKYSHPSPPKGRGVLEIMLPKEGGGGTQTPTCEIRVGVLLLRYDPA